MPIGGGPRAIVKSCDGGAASRCLPALMARAWRGNEASRPPYRHRAPSEAEGGWNDGIFFIMKPGRLAHRNVAYLRHHDLAISKAESAARGWRRMAAAMREPRMAKIAVAVREYGEMTHVMSTRSKCSKSDIARRNGERRASFATSARRGTRSACIDLSTSAAIKKRAGEHRHRRRAPP